MKNTNATHKTQKYPGKQPLPPRKQEYIYHWNRIIGVGVVFLLLLGLTGYGLFLWFDSSAKEGFDVAETLPETEVAVEDTRPGLEEALFRPEIEEDPQSFTHAEEERLPGAVAETTDSNSNSQDTQTQLLDEAIIAEDNSAQKFAENQPLETESPAPEMTQLSTAHHTNEATVEETLVDEIDLEDSDPVHSVQSPEEMPAVPIQEERTAPQAEIPQNITLEPQGESPDIADTTHTADTLNSPFQLKEVEILEPSVKRFLLVGSVSNREPKGELNEISFNADGIAAVWAYSEVIDKRNSRFKYVWLHGGKHIATVSVRVGSNRWRSYSSKLIKQSMSGAWRVELQDGKGRLMASADFFLE